MWSGLIGRFNFNFEVKIEKISRKIWITPFEYKVPPNDQFHGWMCPL